MTLTEAYERRLEFYNKNHDPRDGRFTTGVHTGKLWTGVSAHPDRRTKPTPGEFTATKATAKRIYEADLGGGYTSHVTESTRLDGNILVVRGEIRLNGSRRGYFERSLYRHDDGSISVDHDLLVIDGDHKGHGLADRFNAHAVAEYQKMGVDHVSLVAGDAEHIVGGYAWARQGFRLNQISEEANRAFIDKSLGRIDNQLLKPVYREHAKQIRLEVEALRRAVEAGEDVQPIHIASIGERYARHETRDEDGVKYQTWPGKDVLLGTSWKAVYYFDANRTLQADATDLEHADLRPKFRYEWIEFYNKNHDPRDGRFSSGPGGVSAGPKVKEAYLSRTANSPTPNTTAFGRRINAMLDGDPNLRDLSKATIDKAHAKRVADRQTIDEDELLRTYTVGLPNITHNRSSPWGKSDKQIAKEDAATDEMSQALVRIKQIRSEDHVAQNESERILQEAIDQRIAQDDIYGPLVVRGDFGSIKLDGVRQRAVAKTVVVDDVMEQAVNKVGQEIRKEIDARHFKEFDADGAEDRHREGMAEIQALADQIWDMPLDRKYISIARYSDKVRIHIGAPAVGLEYIASGNPIMLKMNEIIAKYGIVSTDQAQQVGFESNIVHNRILGEVLGEITQLGGRLTATPKNVKREYGGANSHTQVIAAVSKYPEAWINETNLGNKLKFRQVKGRAHYQHSRADGYSEITLDGSIPTAIHEFMHRFERTIPGIVDLEARFHDRRTAGEPEVRLSKLRPGHGYGKDEVTKPDKFFDPYVGKSYHGSAFELLSMGYEHLHSRKDWATMDDDYKAFVLGTLVTAYRG